MKYFGTDGIRGKANVELDAKLAYRAGLALGTVLRKELDRRPLVLIRRDTRISGGMLEADDTDTGRRGRHCCGGPASHL